MISRRLPPDAPQYQPCWGVRCAGRACWPDRSRWRRGWRVSGRYCRSAWRRSSWSGTGNSTRSSSRSRGPRAVGMRDRRVAVDARGACPLSDGDHPVAAFPGRSHPGWARSSHPAGWPGTQAPARRSATACQPGNRTASLLSVHKHVDHLCATAPSLCISSGNAGDSAAWPQP
jgi:hypothetical protein